MSSKLFKLSVITIAVGMVAPFAAPLQAQQSGSSNLTKIGLLNGGVNVLWPPPHRQDSLRERSVIDAAQLSARQVQKVQQQLEARGHEVGEIDGQWNQQTQSAIRDFQSSQGIQVSGQLDEQTVNRLGLDTEDFSSQEQS